MTSALILQSFGQLKFSTVMFAKPIKIETIKTPYYRHGLFCNMFVKHLSFTIFIRILLWHNAECFFLAAFAPATLAIFVSRTRRAQVVYQLVHCVSSEMVSEIDSCYVYARTYHLPWSILTHNIGVFFTPTDSTAKLVGVLPRHLEKGVNGRDLLFGRSNKNLQLT